MKLYLQRIALVCTTSPPDKNSRLKMQFLLQCHAHSHASVVYETV